MPIQAHPPLFVVNKMLTYSFIKCWIKALPLETNRAKYFPEGRKDESTVFPVYTHVC